MSNKPYSNFAAQDAPAIIVLLMDLSATMYRPFNSIQTRSDCMIEGIHTVVKNAICRSTKRTTIVDRYKLAAFGYSNEAYSVDFWHGAKDISDISKNRLPASFSQPKAMSHGFKLVRDFLYYTVPFLPSTSPAPMVIHFTTGPSSVVDEIKGINSSDGRVLVETILCSERYSEEEFVHRDHKEFNECYSNLVKIS